MIVEFVQTKEMKVPFIRTGCYSFREDRGFHFIQKLCCWAMNKIGANFIDETIELTRHTIDTDVFMERIFRQKYHLEAHFNRKPKRILVGAEDFERIMNCPEIRQGLMFNASYNYGREICGLQVEVIPWMRGILVMP